MDIKQLWINVLDLWGALDQHPLVHSSLSLLLLLAIALFLGRMALPDSARNQNAQPPAGPALDQ